PIRSRQANARVVMADVTGIDVAAKEVKTDRTAPFHYDFLVIATGATHSYFGHDEWAPFAPGLKRIEDATEIRRRLLRAFEAAELAPSEAERRRLMNFIVVGGGPTGVELAGACAEVARYVLSRDFRRIDPRTSRILLIEAGPRILPSFPEDLARYAHRALERMGVEVLTSTAVAGCDEMGVATADGRRFEGATIVWAAGVTASPAANWLGAPHDRAGRAAGAPRPSGRRAPGVYAARAAARAPPAGARAGPGPRPARQAGGPRRGRGPRGGGGGRPAPPAFPLPPLRRSRHHRPTRRDRLDRPVPPARLSRLAVLEHHPHLF